AHGDLLIVKGNGGCSQSGDCTESLLDQLPFFLSTAIAWRAVRFAPVERNVATSELLVGVEGLALLRHLYDGDDEDAASRLGEGRAILDGDAVQGAAEPIVEADPREGYAAWAASYDEPGNPIVALELPAVWSMLGDVPAGRA